MLSRDIKLIMIGTLAAGLMTAGCAKKAEPQQTYQLPYQQVQQAPQTSQQTPMGTTQTSSRSQYIK